MTFHDDAAEVVPELSLKVEGDDGGRSDKCVQLKERLLLSDCEDAVAGESFLLGASVFSWRLFRNLWRWCKFVFLVLCLGILAAFCIKWVGPFLIDKETGSGLHDTKNPASRYFNTSEKYILKSYFDKYETLEDATFSDFFEYDLPSTMWEPVTNNGNVVVRFSVLRRSLIGEGSHRHLYSSIGLLINPNLEPQTPPHLCDVIITERLPLGVFADPFELQNLQDRGGLPWRSKWLLVLTCC